MFDIPQNAFDLVDGPVDELLKNTTIKPVAVRSPIYWRVTDYGDDKLLTLYTRGSRSSAGYHIGLIIEEREIHGQRLNVAVRLYNDGPGKSWAQRLAFTKGFIQQAPTGGYIKTN